jgi:hypothetical protein
MLLPSRLSLLCVRYFPPCRIRRLCLKVDRRRAIALSNANGKGVVAAAFDYLSAAINRRFLWRGILEYFDGLQQVQEGKYGNNGDKSPHLKR